MASSVELVPVSALLLKHNLDFLFNRLVNTGALSAKLTTGFWQNLNSSTPHALMLRQKPNKWHCEIYMIRWSMKYSKCICTCTKY